MVCKILKNLQRLYVQFYFFNYYRNNYTKFENARKILKCFYSDQSYSIRLYSSCFINNKDENIHIIIRKAAKQILGHKNNENNRETNLMNCKV